MIVAIIVTVAVVAGIAIGVYVVAAIDEERPPPDEERTKTGQRPKR